MISRCEKLDMFVSYEMNLGSVGKTLLQAIVGRMANAETEEVFDTCKELINNALLNLIADDYISQEDFVATLELIEECTFEDEDEPSLKLIEMQFDDAIGLLQNKSLYYANLVYGNNKEVGKSFKFNDGNEQGQYRDLIIMYDGKVFVSEEY